jgi:hypothetical protein
MVGMKTAIEEGTTTVAELFAKPEPDSTPSKLDALLDEKG